MITNTRETGKLEVHKDLSPSDDAASSTSRSTAPPTPTRPTSATAASTGEETLNTGNHTVGETAGTDTDLADYQKSIDCRDENGTGNVVAETTSATTPAR